MAEIQQVVDYIEAHLTDELTIVTLAELAGYSPWHFYHIFTECTGTPVMAYIRVRRLQRAAAEMGHGRKLIDLALDYGFETQAGFCKAFRRHFGCSPTRYRLHAQRHINRLIDPTLLQMASKGEEMEDQVTIRIMRESDAEDLWENIYSRNTLIEVRNRITGYLQECAADHAVPMVAEVDGHVVGVTYLKFHDTPPETGTLYDVVVHPAFQRMGIARRLFDACRAAAIDKGKGMLFVSTRVGNPAEHVYRKFDFIEYGRTGNGTDEQRFILFYQLLPQP